MKENTLTELRRRRLVVVEEECHSFIEIYRAAKSRVQSNFERFHVTFTFVNDPSQFFDLPVDLRLITFQAFHRAVMWKVKEGLADLVAFDKN
jgi:hypothetical protein